MPPKPPKAAPKPKTTKGEAQRTREIEHQTVVASSEDEPDDDTQIRFQEAMAHACSDRASRVQCPGKLIPR
jgi:hypothetical protein